MSLRAIRKDAFFSPADYRKSIADMFRLLDARQQRDLADRIAILPRHIHNLATNGLIAMPVAKSR